MSFRVLTIWHEYYQYPNTLILLPDSVHHDVCLLQNHMLFAWLSQYSKLKQGEISEDEYDNWRYNYPNIEPTTGFVKNAISDDLDAELQDALSEEMKKRGLL